MPTSRSSSSDPEAGICWVQEQHVLSRAGQGWWQGAQAPQSSLLALAAPWLGWWEGSRYVDAHAGYTPPRTLKDTGLGGRNSLGTGSPHCSASPH